MAYTDFMALHAESGESGAFVESPVCYCRAVKPAAG